MKQKRKHKCLSCEKIKADVKYVENPYSVEINDDRKKQWLCEDCVEEYRGQI